jgi:hypothetical protein
VWLLWGTEARLDRGTSEGVTGNLTEGFTGQSDGEVRPTAMNRGGGGSLM